jgi:hypothetical protein
MGEAYKVSVIDTKIPEMIKDVEEDDSRLVSEACAE